VLQGSRRAGSNAEGLCGFMDRSMLTFTLDARDPGSRARAGTLETAHGAVATPVFMAVGTRATVTGLDPADLETLSAPVVLGNTYHLMLRPGLETFRRVGGIHRFMGYSGPVLTDSGGYQIFSLAADRTVSEAGATFRSYVDGRRELLSPERSIELQTAIGSDVMMVLDECIASNASLAQTRAAMERTHRWAVRSLQARRNAARGLFAIVQGGIVPELRRQSAAFLTAHPFDGFAIGGLAVGDTRAQREDVTRASAELLPAERPRYLMGVGTPPDLLEGMLAGIDMFDCVLPTHLAWQGTAFTSTGRVKVTRGSYATADVTLDEACSCNTCRRFSRAYLNHLFKCSEPLGPRLLSLHNLHHYFSLMREARTQILAGTFAAWARTTLDAIDRHEHRGRLGAPHDRRQSRGAA
jgi:queuine tRNA-ribosyltransferase